MKIKLFSYGSLFLLLTLFSGCSVIGDIFKAGVWSGIIVVVLVVVLIIYLVGKMGKKG